MISINFKTLVHLTTTNVLHQEMSRIAKTLEMLMRDVIYEDSSAEIENLVLALRNIEDMVYAWNFYAGE
jgi:hypothetical protein